MKRRKQIGKLIYTPRWGQGDVELGEDYDGLSRLEKLDVLSYWISDLLSIRNKMIPNPKSWHHFMDKKEWHGLTDEEYEAMAERYVTNYFFDTLEYAKAIEVILREKNT